MSLKVQFFLSVALALILSLFVEGVVAYWHAHRSVEVEMDKALDAADRDVHNSFLSLPTFGSDSYLDRLTNSFNGNRHVEVTFYRAGHLRAASTLLAPPPVPGWFQKLLEIPVNRRVDPAPGGRALIVRADPHNEIGEVWVGFKDGALMLGLFSLLVLGLLHLAVARMRAPLDRLSAGLGALGGGDYAARVSPRAPREIARLAEAFNRMAARLDKSESANARMSRQILAIQEEERAELARELHDEMGPFLFAMRVDAESIEAAARNSGQDEIVARARAVGEAVANIQRLVRLILKQLRSDEFEELGLVAAIENLAAFWRRHIEGVAIKLDIELAGGCFGAEIESAIYRLVQEGLTNAVRHSRARQVHVTIRGGDDIVRVIVDDDGVGLEQRAAGGMGLKGMRERLAGLRGEFSLGPCPGGGARVMACIPRARVRYGIDS